MNESNNKVNNKFERIEKYDITETELLGILKDMLMNNKIDVIAWPGNYLKEKDKAFPIGIRFCIKNDIEGELPYYENKEPNLDIQITQEGLWEVDDKAVKERAEVHLSEATIYQLEKELEKRKAEKGHGEK